MGIDDVLLAKTQSSRMRASASAEDAPLQLEVLEHRLDDEVGPAEAGVVEGGRHALHPLLDVERGQAGTPSPLLEDLAHVAQASAQGVVRGVLHPDAHPGFGRHGGDARTHEPGAQHAELRRSRRAAVPAG